MAGYAADDELAGGEAGPGLGAKAPPVELTFTERLNGVDWGDVPRSEPDSGIGAHAADTEYPAEFGTGYSGDHSAAAHGIPDYSVPGFAYGEQDGGGMDEGFGWLLGPFGQHERLPEPPPMVVDDFGDDAAMVRPYAWTRGRTRANYDLKLETLVSTTEQGQDETLLPQLEHRAVSSLCRYPLSVAEVAAKLSIPLGVARVILSDMAELGLISIHRTFADDDIAAHLVLMERVLSGLRRL